MFKKQRGIRLSYYKQGLVYFLCANFHSLPKSYRDLICKLCVDVGGADSDALFALLTKPEFSVSGISIQFYVSEKKLYNLREKFYLEFWERYQNF